MKIIWIFGPLLLSGCLFKPTKQLEYDAILMADDECHAALDELELDKNIINHRKKDTDDDKKTYVSSPTMCYPDTPIAKLQPTSSANK